MDINTLIRQYENWKIFGRGKTEFQSGKILCDNRKMVVIAPENSVNIIKILSDFPGNQQSIAKEYETLCKLCDHNIGLGCNYLVPEVASYGTSPPYIEMTNMGTSYGLKPIASQEERENLITAISDFASALWSQTHSIHSDLSWNNITRTPSGKVGFIDMESICRAEHPEEMFPMLLVQEKGDLAYQVAKRFSQNAGVSINPALIRDYCQEARWPYMQSWKQHQPGWVPAAQERIDNNLLAWQQAGMSAPFPAAKFGVCITAKALTSG